MVVSVSGMIDLVYNDFYIEDGANVNIIAGCGIHNSGCMKADMMVFILFTLEKMQMYDTWRNTMAKVMEQAQEF